MQSSRNCSHRSVWQIDDSNGRTSFADVQREQEAAENTMQQVSILESICASTTTDDTELANQPESKPARSKKAKESKGATVGSKAAGSGKEQRRSTDCDAHDGATFHGFTFTPS